MKFHWNSQGSVNRCRKRIRWCLAGECGEGSLLCLGRLSYLFTLTWCFSQQYSGIIVKCSLSLAFCSQSHSLHPIFTLQLHSQSLPAIFSTQTLFWGGLVPSKSVVFKHAYEEKKGRVIMSSLLWVLWGCTRQKISDLFCENRSEAPMSCAVLEKTAPHCTAKIPVYATVLPEARSNYDHYALSEQP